MRRDPCSSHRHRSPRGRIATLRIAPWLAGAAVLALAGAALGSAVLVAARVAHGPDRTRESLHGFPRDGRPALVVAGDASCGACRRAFADLDAAADLEAAGVRRVRHRRGLDGVVPPTWRRSLEGGLLPVYVLVDERGRALALRRGYLPPTVLREWVRVELLGEGGAFP
ncbi:MAG TPA: hypothetical protein VKU85_11550 [bacterium]|nr:hypothetical protein [bacterium]